LSCEKVSIKVHIDEPNSNIEKKAVSGIETAIQDDILRGEGPRWLCG
jgi:hypothetical protein